MSDGTRLQFTCILIVNRCPFWSLCAVRLLYIWVFFVYTKTDCENRDTVICCCVSVRIFSVSGVQIYPWWQLYVTVLTLLGNLAGQVCVCVCSPVFQSFCIIHHGSLVTWALGKRQHVAAKSAGTFWNTDTFKMSLKAKFHSLGFWAPSTATYAHFQIFFSCPDLWLGRFLICLIGKLRKRLVIRACGGFWCSRSQQWHNS